MKKDIYDYFTGLSSWYADMTNMTVFFSMGLKKYICLENAINELKKIYDTEDNPKMAIINPYWVNFTKNGVEDIELKEYFYNQCLDFDGVYETKYSNIETIREIFHKYGSKYF